MIDRKKVIKGLTCCRNGFCFACPYNDGVYGNVDCKQKWADDALELLKEQEPRVLTLDDIAAWVRQKPMGREPIYVEVKDLLGTWGAWMVDEIASYLPETDLSSELYGKTWRVWSAKPTEEQRKEAGWND